MSFQRLKRQTRGAGLCHWDLGRRMPTTNLSLGCRPCGEFHAGRAVLLVLAQLSFLPFARHDRNFRKSGTGQTPASRSRSRRVGCLGEVKKKNSKKGSHKRVLARRWEAPSARWLAAAHRGGGREKSLSRGERHTHPLPSQHQSPEPCPIPLLSTKSCWYCLSLSLSLLS